MNRIYRLTSAVYCLRCNEVLEDGCVAGDHFVMGRYQPEIQEIEVECPSCYCEHQFRLVKGEIEATLTIVSEV